MLEERFQAFASEGPVHPVHELVGRQRPLRLDDRPLAVQPAWLDRIEPGAFHRQPTHQDPHPAGALTVRLYVPIHACTARLTCQAALSHTSTHTRLPSAASRSAPQARNAVVIRLTGRPSTKRSSTRSWSVRNSP